MSIKRVDTLDFRPVVAVVGGGASGTVLAAQLLRSGGARVVLIERGDRIGRGVAYGTGFRGHLLNVPAAGMSGLPGDHGHFLRFARAHWDAAVEPTSFVPRMIYGGYLEALLAESEQIGRPGDLLRRRGEVVDIAGGVLTLSNGARLRADRVVLALGNLPPRDPPLSVGGWPADPARYVRDPWSPGALALRAPGPVLLVGTGLTMVDVALQLSEHGHSSGLVALSRGGLLPHAHRSGGAPPSVGVPVPDPTPSLLELLRFVRSAVVVAEVAGGDWRDAINALRPLTSELWAALPLQEQRRFGERLARYWDTHRHRLAPQIAEALQDLIGDGRLVLASGRIRSVTPAGDALLVSVRERAGGELRSLRVASVVNCTGPSGDVRSGGSRLLDALCASGAIRPHPFGLGLDTCPDGALRDAGGQPSDLLFTLGPLRRGELWETTAVPEIRVQAQLLAKRLVAEPVYA